MCYDKWRIFVILKFDKFYISSWQMIISHLFPQFIEMLNCAILVYRVRQWNAPPLSEKEGKINTIQAEPDAANSRASGQFHPISCEAFLWRTWYYHPPKKCRWCNMLHFQSSSEPCCLPLATHVAKKFGEEVLLFFSAKISLFTSASC